MPLLETKGAASAQGFGLMLGSSYTPTYIEDVFSTWLYTGNGSTQTITNGIDLSTKGGLVWIKGRSGTSDDNKLTDTVRGATKSISSNAATGEVTDTTGLTAFGTTGFTLGSNATYNANGRIYASWTFREQAKFFDVVTYTGTGVDRTVSHNLGSVPGCILVKNLNTATNWQVYHRSLGAGKRLELNTTIAAANTSIWNSTTPTTSEFSVGGSANTSGDSYVAYLFAHDAGGFGLTGSDNVISCGSYLGTASTQTIELGYEPQWLLIKNTTNAGNWLLFDNVRSLAVTSPTTATLLANTTGVETSNTYARVESTGFTVYGDAVVNANGNTFIYIAIRRGPMKKPTDATKVFMPTVYTGTNVDNRLVNTTIAPDMVWVRQRDDAVLAGMVVGDRLRGNPYLLTGGTAAENSDVDSLMTPTSGYGNSFSAMNGFGCGNDATSKLNINTASNNHIAEAFKRAPGFFDVVCYTGNDVSARAVNHNLGVAPELVIVKARNDVANWPVYASVLGNDKTLYLNLTNASATSGIWGNTTATSLYFYVGVAGDYGINNATGLNYVAYLFASCPGVSNVSTIAGTGSTLQINCGFTGGARFVLIKRTDSTGDWYVWDSARGIVSGNDPYLRLNSTAAEVTNTNWVNTTSNGFELTDLPGNLVNINGASYIYLAIA